jgi:hypothetical protein
MKDIKRAVSFLITGLQTYKLLILPGLFILSIKGPAALLAQAPDPAKCIRELKEGYLIVRFPAYRAKIDTLKAMTERADDPVKKARFEKLLQETLEQRDTMFADYVEAFKNHYRFSKVAYFFDYDAHDLNRATYYDLEGGRLAVADLSEKPLFYIHFERTEESRIDALVIYDRLGKRISDPFPNNFSRGGINLLFIKIADKNFPAWRVGKINKRLIKYYQENNI